MTNQPAPESSFVDEVQQLTWGLLDEQLSDDEITRLEQLVCKHDEARQAYVCCVQMEIDLKDHFANQSETNQAEVKGEASKKSPVLGFLNDGDSPIGMMPPILGPES